GSVSSRNACSSPARARCSVACSTTSGCHSPAAFRSRLPRCLHRQRFPGPKGNTMTETTSSPALRTALAYYQAWTSHDLDRAMSFVADEIVCDAPAGRLEGAGAYRAFMGPFVQILRDATLIAAFGDDQTAMIMYETRTVPV